MWNPDVEGEEAGSEGAPAEVPLGDSESRGGSSCERPPGEAEMEGHGGPSVEAPPCYTGGGWPWELIYGATCGGRASIDGYVSHT